MKPGGTREVPTERKNQGGRDAGVWFCHRRENKTRYLPDLEKQVNAPKRGGRE